MRGMQQAFTEELTVPFSQEMAAAPSRSPHSSTTDKWAEKIEAEQVNLLYAQAPLGFIATIDHQRLHRRGRAGKSEPGAFHGAHP